MPYLHFETHERRVQMSATIKCVGEGSSTEEIPEAVATSPEDVMLIRAYLDNSASRLHPRRTLDQFLYHGFDTESRDVDQVVYRYCKKDRRPLMIYMVDQLWLWTFGKGM